VPLALLAWLGQRSLAQDRIVAEHQAIELAEARLREAQILVHSFINEMQQTAVTALSSLEIKDTVSNDNIGRIREVINADPFLEQVFILNGERQLLFPQDTVIHSNSERSFAESFSSVLNDENTFRAKPPSEISRDSTGDSTDSVSSEKRRASNYLENLLPSRSQVDRVTKIRATLASTQQDTVSTIETGWTTWDTGTATDIYLWHRTSNNVLVGQKLSSAYWLSQLIARLPSGVSETVLNNASIRLIDKRQRTIYQWGSYTLNETAAGEPTSTPIAQDWVSYPLDGWRLEYYAPPHAIGGIKLPLFVLLFLSLIGLIAIGARLIWKEYRREMHNAEQRVSFVNQVSHELKTPLTNICIYADMLEALINNVLNFSRAQQQKISIHKSLTTADDVIKLTINKFAPAFEAKAIKIKTDLNTPSMVMLDSELLEQVLNNLLSNIEKYAADGGIANISSTFSDEHTIILIRDAGRGIPKALKGKIFEPFERGSDSLIEGVSGTGIGLSIARDLCRIHGGDLELVNSEEGACFKVSLFTERSE